MRLELAVNTEIALPELLLQAGVLLDQRCGGRGVCRRCLVKIIAGNFITDGQTGCAPAVVPACRTRMLGPNCTIEVALAQTVPLTDARSTIATGNAAATTVPVAAVDLGTTTIQTLMMTPGAPPRTASGFNRQLLFGDNVLDRISAVGQNPRYLAELQKLAADSINALLEELGAGQVRRIAVAGNTVMSCLLHGIDPGSIGVSPFRPPQTTFPAVSGAELGLTFCPDAEILTLPAVSGFVGGDLVAGIAETRLKPGEMLVDLGTNCEMIFHSGTRLLASAAAAGPAFEGGKIGCGGRAISGAIDHIFADGHFSVIGGGQPVGGKLCGSALIDLLAVWRQTGRIDGNGRFQNGFQGHITTDIAVTEAEIAELLSAKAAVFAGITTLEAQAECRIKKLYLAGNFACFLNFENAIAIGMLPDIEILPVGNTSLAGAVQTALRGAPYLRELEKLSREPQALELSQIPEFTAKFIAALRLP